MATIGSNNPFPSILIDDSTAAPSAPASGYQRIYIDTSDGKVKRITSTGGIRNIESHGPASMTLLTSGTGATYTVPSNIYRIKLRGVGPGGGGGGSDQSTAGSGCAGGGGAGGYFEDMRDVTPAQTFTYTVGVGGTGGAAGNNAGNPGTTATVFDSTGSALTGNVGSGGVSMAAGTSLLSAAGGAGGTATGGDVNIAGQAGAYGYRFATATLLGGQGASSPLGIGGQTFHGATAGSGTGYGSGGGGSLEFANQTDRAGGSGANGVIIIEEYN